MMPGTMPGLMADVEKYHKRSEKGFVGLLNQYKVLYHVIEVLHAI